MPLVFVLAFAPSACIKAPQDTLLNYSESAELLYKDAMDDYDDRDCVSAQPKFEDVRKKFPYSRYAVDAELRVADCQFMQETFAEAAISYEQFVSLHPTHEQADYAAYRRCESFVEQIPTDVFIMPSPYQRDQAATRDARTALSAFITRYPKSKWQSKAAELLKRVVDALVQHEMYVAEFYLDADDRNAAAVRLEQIRANFAESSMVPGAMFLQAMTYLKLDRKQDAKQVLQDIVTYYPTHYESRRAEEYLKVLN
jgi:outer membrane protein assembly factor BamD